LQITEDASNPLSLIQRIQNFINQSVGLLSMLMLLV
jgi:hypothetical protein